MKLASNKIALAIGAGVVATGAVAASAASLGTLNASSLGTSTTVVASCQTSGTPITVSWDAPTYSSNGYFVSGATLSGLDSACNGKNVKMVVANTGGTALTNGTATTSTIVATAGNAPVAFPVAGFDSNLAEHTTLTIYGS